MPGSVYGDTGDIPASDNTSNWSIISLLKGIFKKTGSNSFVSSPTVTRPADTTAYTAGDVVGGVITFANATPGSNAGVFVNFASLLWNLAAVPSGMTSFRLHLFSVTPPSALADNTAWDLPSSDRAAYLGFIDLGTPADVGSSVYVQTSGPNLTMQQMFAASTSLFGYMVTNGGYTPGESDSFVPSLRSIGV